MFISRRTTCPVEYLLAANTYVANVAYVTTTIYKFETCKNSYNSQSCKLSTTESVKNILTKKLVRILKSFEPVRIFYKLEK